MSRLGAIKMKERQWENAHWTLGPREDEPEEEPIVYEKWTEDQARIGCGLALFFLKLNPPDTWWYEYCTTQAHLYPMGSYRYTFWWTLRVYGEDEERGAAYLGPDRWTEWEQDFEWKLEQFRSGICSGDQEEHPW